MTFTVSGCRPGAPALIEPSGGSANPPPWYWWYDVGNASWYYLWVNGPSGTPVIQQWYTAAQANCDGKWCWVTNVTTSAGGGQTWWVQTRGIRVAMARGVRERVLPSRPDPYAAYQPEEEMVRRFWPHDDPIGKRITGDDPADLKASWYTVIGVVKHTMPREAGCGGKGTGLFSLSAVRRKVTEPGCPELNRYVECIRGRPPGSAGD